jgi:hypothetical protein
MPSERVMDDASIEPLPIEASIDQPAVDLPAIEPVPVEAASRTCSPSRHSQTSRRSTSTTSRRDAGRSRDEDVFATESSPA